MGHILRCYLSRLAEDGSHLMGERKAFILGMTVRPLLPKTAWLSVAN
jgi:hypothetical protein